ncbi:MAG: LPXTG cell wall anchor domain-containing protein, partial [Candidatus Microsaccharimonas sp.]
THEAPAPVIPDEPSAPLAPEGPIAPISEVIVVSPTTKHEPADYSELAQTGTGDYWGLIVASGVLAFGGLIFKIFRRRKVTD